MTWFQIWTVCWQVAIFLTPLLFACAFLWLKSQFVTKADATAEKNRVDAAIATMRADLTAEHNRVDAAMSTQKLEADRRHEQLKDRSADHDGRLKMLESNVTEPPTRHTLNNELTKLVATVAGVEKALSGVGKQMDTMHGYVRTLVERGLGE